MSSNSASVPGMSGEYTSNTLLYITSATVKYHSDVSGATDQGLVLVFSNGDTGNKGLKNLTVTKGVSTKTIKDETVNTSGYIFTSPTMTANGTGGDVLGNLSDFAALMNNTWSYLNA